MKRSKAIPVASWSASWTVPAVTTFVTKFLQRSGHEQPNLRIIVHMQNSRPTLLAVLHALSFSFPGQVAMLSLRKYVDGLERA